jgi:hypothetical protein
MPDAISFDNILKIAEVLSIIGGGGLVAFKLGRSTTRVETAMALQGSAVATMQDEVKELKAEIKKLAEIASLQAVQTERMNQQAERINRVEANVNELAHGRGFIGVEIRKSGR